MSNPFEDIPKRIVNTVGYHESSNKEDFIKGAEVALSLAERSHSVAVSGLHKTIDTERLRRSEIEDDISTLVGIIKKYTKE